MRRQARYEEEILMRWTLMHADDAPPPGCAPATREKLLQHYLHDVGYLLRALGAARVVLRQRSPQKGA